MRVRSSAQCLTHLTKGGEVDQGNNLPLSEGNYFKGLDLEQARSEPGKHEGMVPYPA